MEWLSDRKFSTALRDDRNILSPALTPLCPVQSGEYNLDGKWRRKPAEGQIDKISVHPALKGQEMSAKSCLTKEFKKECYWDFGFEKGIQSDCWVSNP